MKAVSVLHMDRNYRNSQFQALSVVTKINKPL
jgi:hypothetical protein